MSHLLRSHGKIKVQLSDGITLSRSHGMAWLHNTFCVLEKIIYNKIQYNLIEKDSFQYLKQNKTKQNNWTVANRDDPYLHYKKTRKRFQNEKNSCKVQSIPEIPVRYMFCLFLFLSHQRYSKNLWTHHWSCFYYYIYFRHRERSYVKHKFYSLGYWNFIRILHRIFNT